MTMQSNYQCCTAKAFTQLQRIHLAHLAITHIELTIALHSIVLTLIMTNHTIPQVLIHNRWFTDYLLLVDMVICTLL